MPAEPSKAKAKRRSSRRELEEFKFDGGHTREIEQKRINGQISCAECRRLKIKCDKQIPCQSCQRRGCAALCPNGSLATGQGTRFVLAATEHLHKRISKMSDRIRRLEDALGTLHAQYSMEPHPLLRDDLLGGNQEREDDPAGAAEDVMAITNSPDMMDAFGTLSITDHGISRFFGPTGGSECLLMCDNPSSNDGSTGDTIDETSRDSKSPSLPGEPRMFSHTFPFTPVGPPSEIQRMIKNNLPSWDRARHLAEAYIVGAAWCFRGVPRDQLMDEILPYHYGADVSRPAEDQNSAHDLALLFLVFAIGSLIDINSDNVSPEAEHFHQIARAALSLQPVLEKPSLLTIQALHLASIYNAMSGNELSAKETNMETTWSMIILAAHLSQTIGLHRDSARWKLPAKMVQRRRLLFWNLFVADSWHSLNTGRPPTFCLDYIDCRYPELGNADGQKDNIVTADDIWSFRFAAECVAEVAARTLTAETPSYTTIMELDRKVREFSIPEDAAAMASSASSITPAAVGPDENVSISESMSRCVMSHSREVILLYIHRSFFAQAIIDNPGNPLKSQYSPSFLAAYRASSTILRTIQAQFLITPKLCAKIWHMWTFAFSAAIVFGTIATRGAHSPLAGNAMVELDNACILFSKVSVNSRRAAKALPILLKLSERAHNALATAGTEQLPSLLKPPSYGRGNEEDIDDELAIFAGRTRFVSWRRPLPQFPQEVSEPSRKFSDPGQSASNPDGPIASTPYYPERPSTAPSVAHWQDEHPSQYQQRDYPNIQEISIHSQPAASFHQGPHYDPSQHHVQQDQRTHVHHAHHSHYHDPQAVAGPSSQPWISADDTRQYETSSIHSSGPHQVTYHHHSRQQQYEPAYATHHHSQLPVHQPELGVIPPDSRLDERWAALLRDSGFIDAYDNNYRSH